MKKGQTVLHSDSVLKYFFEIVSFEKKSAGDNICMKNYPACKELTVCISLMNMVVILFVYMFKVLLP